MQAAETKAEYLHHLLVCVLSLPASAPAEAEVEGVLCFRPRCSLAQEEGKCPVDLWSSCQQVLVEAAGEEAASQGPWSEIRLEVAVLREDQAVEASQVVREAVVRHPLSILHETLVAVGAGEVPLRHRRESFVVAAAVVQHLLLRAQIQTRTKSPPILQCSEMKIATLVQRTRQEMLEVLVAARSSAAVFS